MSLRPFSTANLGPRSWSGATTVPAVAAEGWVRHPAWLPLPDTTVDDSKVVGLCAVWSEPTFLAMTCTGNYTVDWGDGSSENVSSGVTAYHTYSYSDADLDDTNGPVTFTGSTDLVTRTAHGFTDGMRVAFWNIATTTGLMEGAAYCVVNATPDTFQVSLSEGGSAVALTNDGSGTLLPYKQAVVVITPNGGTLTSVNLQVKHNTSGLRDNYCSPWLDLLVAGKDFNSTGMTVSASSTVIKQALLQRFVALSMGSQGSLDYLINFCSAAVYIEVTALSATSANSFCANCIALRELYATFSSAMLSVQSFASNCHALKTVRLSGTSGVTSFQNAFYWCYSLTELLPLDTSAATSMQDVFNSCRSLEKVPPLDTALVENFAGMFGNCYSLKLVPPLDVSSATSMGGTFFGCYMLTDVPLLSIPATVTTMNSGFSTCYSLVEFPALDLGNIPLASGLSSMFTNCYGLRRIKATGIKVSFAIDACSLSSAALDELYTNLATVTGQTITVTGNYGTSGDTPSIATAKGWTVTG